MCGTAPGKKGRLRSSERMLTRRANRWLPESAKAMLQTWGSEQFFHAGYSTRKS
jgi:hypothetical protein